MVPINSSSEDKLRHLRNDIREEDIALVKDPLLTQVLTEFPQELATG